MRYSAIAHAFTGHIRELFVVATAVDALHLDVLAYTNVGASRGLRALTFMHCVWACASSALDGGGVLAFRACLG